MFEDLLDDDKVQNSVHQEDDKDKVADNFDPDILIPEEVLKLEGVQELKKKTPDLFDKHIAYLFSQGEIEELRKLVLEPNFKTDYPEYSCTGELLYQAIQNNEQALVDDLVQAGFPIPSSIVIQAIDQSEFRMINYIVNEGLYPTGIVPLMFWLLLKKNFTGPAKTILAKEDQASGLFMGFIIELTESIEVFLTSADIVNKVLKCALDNNQDHIACRLIVQTPLAVDAECVRKAVSNVCPEALKIIWTGNILLPDVKNDLDRADRCVIWEKLNMDLEERAERKKINKLLRISSILQSFLVNNKKDEAAKVLDWPDACNEGGIIRVLAVNGQEELMLKHLSKTKIDITAGEFLEVFDKGFYKACLYMMKSKEPRSALIKTEVQSKLTELLETGTYSLYAIDMLSYISYRDWNGDLTIRLCEVLDTLVNESSEILLCTSPILFCVLVIEFLNNISLNSIQNKHRCLECADSYIQQAFHLEESYKDNDVLRYMLMDNDSRGRAAIVIIAENSLFKLLEDMSVGAIISKLWKGPESQSLFECSRLYNSLFTDDFLMPVVTKSPFQFSFSVWTRCCSLRYFVNSVSILFLLVVYNALIIEGITHLADLTKTQSTTSLLRISEILITGLMCDLASQYLFCLESRRPFKLDAPRLADIGIFGMMLLILAGLQDNMGPGKKYSDTNPDVFVGLIHSMEDLLVWIRFLLILITTKRLGPFLYMIYNIMKKMVSFYFLFACFSIWFAAVFTALFSKPSIGDYDSFWISMRTLYSASLGGMNFDNFAGSDKRVFGALLLGFYLIITNIILLNLFIALFSTIYQQISEQVESTYRSTVILTYQKWKWDNKYGLLILFSAPFSVFGFLSYPILHFSKRAEYWNQKFSKILYLGIFGFCEFIVLIAVDIMLIPFVYIKGFSKYPKSGSTAMVSIENDENIASRKYSFSKLALWTFCGIFIAGYNIFYDMTTFWKVLLIDYNTDEVCHPFATEDNIKALKECFPIIKDNVITVEKLVSAWAYVKSIMNKKDVTDIEKDIALDFFLFFCKNVKLRTVEVRDIERIVKEISDYDVGRFSNIRLPYFQKGIDSFRNLIGGVEVDGVILPKKLSQPGGPVDTVHMKNTLKIVEEMISQITSFETLIQNIKNKKAAAENKENLDNLDN